MFTNSYEIKILSNMINVPNVIFIEILKYMPEYIRRMHMDDLHLSNKLKRVTYSKLRKFDNNRIIFVKKCSLFNNYSDTVVKIVLDYIALYPKFTIETDTISRSFKNRNLDTLLVKCEFELLNGHLKKKDILYNVKFMANIMRLALSLNLTILAEKCGAIIAMFIKDKPLPFIKNIFGA